MRRGRFVNIVALCLLLSLAPADAHHLSAQEINAELQKGSAAARAGDYSTVHTVWGSLARHGNAEAQFRYGWLWEFGLGTKKDFSKSAHWYALAALQGHAKAQYNLGIMLLEGRGVRRNDAWAAEYFRLAAMQEHAKAQYNLGVLYQTGRGVRKDPAEARYWFNRAKANGVGRLAEACCGYATSRASVTRGTTTGGQEKDREMNTSILAAPAGDAGREKKRRQPWLSQH